MLAQAVFKLGLPVVGLQVLPPAGLASAQVSQKVSSVRLFLWFV